MPSPKHPKRGHVKYTRPAKPKKSSAAPRHARKSAKKAPFHGRVPAQADLDDFPHVALYYHQHTRAPTTTPAGTSPKWPPAAPGDRTALPDPFGEPAGSSAKPRRSTTGPFTKSAA